MTWATLQREVRENPCVVLGHNWVGTKFAAEQRNRELPIRPVAVVCLRCGKEAAT